DVILHHNVYSVLIAASDILSSKCGEEILEVFGSFSAFTLASLLQSILRCACSRLLIRCLIKWRLQVKTTWINFLPFTLIDFSERPEQPDHNTL
ncbi:hypothetical protein L9F63_022485, partial [Diploptera punctata]